MNYIDYIILAIVIIGFILGFKDGLVRKIIGLIGLVLAIGFAFQFSTPLGNFLAPVLNNEIYLAEITAGILIFLATIFIFSVIKRLVHPVDKVNRFLNQILGGISGTIQIVFFISGFLLFLSIFNFPKQEDIDKSLLYEHTYKVVPETIDLLLGADSEAKYFINEITDKTNELPEIPEEEIIENQVD